MNKALKSVLIAVIAIAVVVLVLLNPEGVGIPLAYTAIGIAALGAIVFPIIQMIGDLKKAKVTLIGVAALVVVFLIAYLCADNKDFTIMDVTVQGSIMQWVEASMYAFYTLLTIAVVGILYSTVSRYFK